MRVSTPLLRLLLKVELMGLRGIVTMTWHPPVNGRGTRGRLGRREVWEGREGELPCLRGVVRAALHWSYSLGGGRGHRQLWLRGMNLWTLATRGWLNASSHPNQLSQSQYTLSLSHFLLQVRRPSPCLQGHTPDE